MKTITEFNTKSFLKTSTKLVLLLSFGLFISCEDEIYPEAGSIADKTQPVAAFSASQNEGPEDEWKTVSFKNQSVSATDYSWDFGDGNASTSFEPDNTYSGEGTYTVTLVASDKLNVTLSGNSIGLFPIRDIIITFYFTKLMQLARLQHSSSLLGDLT